MKCFILFTVVPRVAAGPVSETSFIDDTEAPPPSYEAATSGYVEVPQGSLNGFISRPVTLYLVPKMMNTLYDVLELFEEFSKYVNKQLKDN